MRTKKMPHQRGFTTTGLLMSVWALICLIGVGLGIYAIAHFITKYW